MSTRKRLIASLLVHEGNVVQTRKFQPTNNVGNAFTAVDFFNAWAIDEIAVLEISRNDNHIAAFEEIVIGLSRRCFVPLLVGGKIDSLDTVRRYTRAGADKVIVNTHAVRRPNLIAEIAQQFGTQCVVVSIDGRPNPQMPSGYEVMIDCAREATGRDVVAWAQEAVSLGVGEIYLNQLDRDGARQGYDLTQLRLVANAVAVPVIAMGGVGKWDHLVEGVANGADAVAAGNIFHYTEHSTKKAKEFLVQAGLPVRPPGFYSVKLPRRPTYRPH